MLSAVRLRVDGRATERQRRDHVSDHDGSWTVWRSRTPCRTSSACRADGWSAWPRLPLMLDLARLRALHAVHTHGSVGAAAAALGYTPSARLPADREARTQNGTALLERQGRGVALTAAAQLLVGTAQQLLSIVEVAEVALEERRGQSAGRLTVAAFPSAACGLLPAVLAELACRHEALELRRWRRIRIAQWNLWHKGWWIWLWHMTGTSLRWPLPRVCDAQRSATTGATCCFGQDTRWRPVNRCSVRNSSPRDGSASRRARSATTG